MISFISLIFPIVHFVDAVLGLWLNDFLWEYIGPRWKKGKKNFTFGSKLHFFLFQFLFLFKNYETTIKKFFLFRIHSRKLFTFTSVVGQKIWNFIILIQNSQEKMQLYFSRCDINWHTYLNIKLLLEIIFLTTFNSIMKFIWFYF